MVNHFLCVFWCPCARTSVGVELLEVRGWRRYVQFSRSYQASKVVEPISFPEEAGPFSLLRILLSLPVIASPLQLLAPGLLSELP